MSGTCDACGDRSTRLYLYEDGGSYCRDCYTRGGEPDRYGNSITVEVDPEVGVTISDEDGEVIRSTTDARHEQRAREYLREALDASSPQMREDWKTEAMDEAGKIENYERSDELLDEISDRIQAAERMEAER